MYDANTMMRSGMDARATEERPAQTPFIRVAIETLDREITAVSDVVARIVNEIEPILRPSIPDHPESCQRPEPRSNQSDIAGRIADRAETIAELRRSLERISSRIDL